MKACFYSASFESDFIYKRQTKLSADGILCIKSFVGGLTLRVHMGTIKYPFIMYRWPDLVACSKTHHFMPKRIMSYARQKG